MDKAIAEEVIKLRESTQRLTTRIAEYETLGQAEFLSAAELHKKDLQRQQLYLTALEYQLKDAQVGGKVFSIERCINLLKGMDADDADEVQETSHKVIETLSRMIK